MYKHKQKIIILLALVVAVFCIALPALAMEVQSGDFVTVPEGKIKGPLFTAGNDVIVNADVDGDVFAAGENVTINGKVNGDLLAAGNHIRINGSISGDARVAGADVEIKGEIGQSLTAAARELRQSEGSRVNRDTLFMVRNAVLSGVAGRQLMGSGESVFLNGPVADSVKLWSVGSLNIGPAAKLSGDLAYGSRNAATLSPQAKIEGATTWNQIIHEARPQHRAEYSWISQLIWLIAGILVWGVFFLIFPRVWSNLSETIIQKPWAALGWGFLLMLTAPLAILLLLVTVVGIPLSLSLATVYAALLYAGKIIIGETAGRYLSRRLGWESKVHQILPFMIGFLGLILLTNIPVVGFIINIIVSATAIGAVSLALYNYRRRPATPIAD
ncbi:MAG: bactofilin family protein [Desulfocucumaceae bacterium]